MKRLGRELKSIYFRACFGVWFLFKKWHRLSWNFFFVIPPDMLICDSSNLFLSHLRFRVEKLFNEGFLTLAHFFCCPHFFPLRHIPYIYIYLLCYSPSSSTFHKPQISIWTQKTEGEKKFWDVKNDKNEDWIFLFDILIFFPPPLLLVVRERYGRAGRKVYTAVEISVTSSSRGVMTCLVVVLWYSWCSLDDRQWASTPRIPLQIVLFPWSWTNGCDINMPRQTALDREGALEVFLLALKRIYQLRSGQGRTCSQTFFSKLRYTSLLLYGSGLLPENGGVEW